MSSDDRMLKKRLK